MSEHQDATAAAMGRRIQDSALRAARLLAQHNEELNHCHDLQAEHSEYLAAKARAHAIHLIDEGEDG